MNEVVPQDTKFYLIRAQAYKIGNSDPAPLLTIEAGPSEERTAGGEVKKEFAERDKKRYEFFEQLLILCNQKTNLFSNIAPVGYQAWVNTGAGKAGLAWSMSAMKKTVIVMLFLCSSSAEINKSRFDILASKKKEIEDDFGEALIWDFKDSRKQQYIKSLCPFGGVEDEEKWPAVQNDMVDRLIKLEKALRPHIKSLV